MTVKQRLIDFIKYLDIPNTDFEKKINVGNAYVSGMRKSPSPEKIEDIAIAYPQLNIEWLLTGKGEMIKEVKEKDINVEFHQDDIFKMLIQIQANVNIIGNYVVDTLAKVNNENLKTLSERFEVDVNREISRLGELRKI